MNHGVIAFDPGFGSAIWQLALELEDWAVLYGPRSIESGNYRGEHHQSVGEIARWAYARAVGDIAAQDYARYEPQTAEAFGRITRSWAARPDWAVAVPYSVTDEQAVGFLNRMIELYPDSEAARDERKKLRPLFQPIAIPTRWVCLLGFMGEDPSIIVMADDADIPGRVEELSLAVDGYRVKEKW